MSELPNLASILWMCRRGMLELDLVLNNFARVQYNDLIPEMKQEFVLLLKEDDPVLYDILIKKTVTAPQHVARITALILKPA